MTPVSRQSGCSEADKHTMEDGNASHCRFLTRQRIPSPRVSMPSAASLACAPRAPTSCASGSAGWPRRLRRTLGLDTMRPAPLDPVITERVACAGYTRERVLAPDRAGGDHDAVRADPRWPEAGRTASGGARPPRTQQRREVCGRRPSRSPRGGRHDRGAQLRLRRATRAAGAGGLLPRRARIRRAARSRPAGGCRSAVRKLQPAEPHGDSRSVRRWRGCGRGISCA